MLLLVVHTPHPQEKAIMLYPLPTLSLSLCTHPHVLSQPLLLDTVIDCLVFMLGMHTLFGSIELGLVLSDARVIEMVFQHGIIALRRLA